MILNHLKIAWRTLLKNRGYSFINVTGLAVGLTSVILIFIYIQDELTYDTVHPAPSLTFGIGIEYTDEHGEKGVYGAVPAGLSLLMKDQIPEVVEIFRYIVWGWPYSMRNPDEDKVLVTKDGEVIFVEKTYPDVMYFPLLQGNREEVFSHPNSVVLSETAAQRLFGDVNVVGRQVEMKHKDIGNEYISLEITGVMKDYPGNVHLQPDYLISIEFLDHTFRENYGLSVAEALSTMDRFYTPTYIRLAEHTDISKVEADVERIISEHFKDQPYQIAPFFRNITDFHFDSEVNWTWWNRAADFDYIIIFGSIGLMILFIACINYMNLATAKSAKRSREVGVRKSLGSSRWHLMFQFFQESLLTTLLALLMALLLLMVALPTFNELADKHFTLASLFQADIFIALLLIWLGVALISSSYPAIFLSGFKPVEVLKGKFTLGKGPTYFRKTLVISQFVVSVLLIISTGIILQQMHMLQSTKLYNQAEQILMIGFGAGIAPMERYQTLKNEILRDPDIEEVALAVGLPRRSYFSPMTASFTLPEISGDQVYTWKQLGGDYDFPNVFDLELMAGRSFDVQNISDSNNYIINETALQALNKTPDEIIGYTLLDTATDQSGKIIGVVKDFHFESIHTSIKPTAIQGKPHSASQCVYVKLPADRLQEKLAVVEEKWKEVLPGTGFAFRFLSEEFEGMYYNELKITNLVQFFSILAVFIACLGLYGLASYTAEQKTKEIGIRKVMGATVPQILVMLVSDFLKMILIACVLALPLGYWIMQDWLQNFVYRINIGWFIFALSVVFIIGLTLLIVAYESIKASMINPTKALRYE